MLMRCCRWMGFSMADIAGPPPMRLRSSLSETSIRRMDCVALIAWSSTPSTLFSFTGQSAGMLVSLAVNSDAAERESVNGRPRTTDDGDGATDTLPVGCGPFLITLAITSPVAVLLYTMLPLMMVFEAWSPGLDNDSCMPSVLEVCGTRDTVAGTLAAFIGCCMCIYCGNFGGRPRRDATGKACDKPVIQQQSSLLAKYSYLQTK